MYEELEPAAVREVKEETGLEVCDLEFVGHANSYNEEIGAHYVTIFYVADWRSGEPENTEPDKCERLEWFSWSELPDPLFWPTRKFVDTGYNPFNI